VNLKGVRLERLRDFGDAWLALGLWRLAGTILRRWGTSSSTPTTSQTDRFTSNRGAD